MKRKIQLITLLCCTLVFGACDSWLDVKPYDQIAEEDLELGNRFPEITERRLHRVK